jgi:DNA-binding transcriptional MerR regulator
MTELTPAQVAETTGFSLDTLRYYEKQGLLGDIERTPGGRRRYRESDVEWLGLVRCLRDTGMPIADLREYSRLAADASTLRERLALLEAHDEKVQADIDALRAQQDRLREKIAWYREQL